MVWARVSTSPLAASRMTYSSFRRFSHSVIVACTFSGWAKRSGRTYFTRTSTTGHR